MTRLLLIHLWFLSGYAAASVLTSNHEMLVDSRNVPVEISRNANAHDPSVAELFSFLHTCNVNQRPYISGKFVCTEYAIVMQRKATAAGLRAGLVNVEFTQGIGHCLVVFQTERGKVFVDFTGIAQGDPNNYLQTIGYLSQGRYYGRLPLNVAKKNPTDYAYYLEIQTLWKKHTQLKTILDAGEVALSKSQTRLEQYHRQLNRSNARAVAAFNQLVAQHNQLVTQQQERANLYNSVGKYLAVNYEINPYPVKSVDIWWP